jgi:hypothetical protein
MLSVFVNDNRNNWDDHLPYLLSTGYSPHKMLFGRDLSCPFDANRDLSIPILTFDLLFVDIISTQSRLRQRNEASHLDHNFFLTQSSFL